MSSGSAVKLALARRALADIASIRDYSAVKWGVETAEGYIDDLQTALDRIRHYPGLLKPHPHFLPGFSSIE